MIKRAYIAAGICGLLMSVSPATAQDVSWPAATMDAKAGARWWWLGSAVDEANLKWNIEEYAKKGIGTLEITPIYGVKGNEKNELSFLSPQWMKALKYTEEQGARNGVGIDMNTGTGWPFGGPSVPIDEAACKAVFVDSVVSGKVVALNISAPQKEKQYSKLQCVMAFGDGKAIDVSQFVEGDILTWKAPANTSWRIIALYAGRTRQKVKRAAPGGEGYVIDHYDKTAVKHYLELFERAFESSGTPYPKVFFNDSYEVYGADWTPSMLKEFEARRGYRLQEKLNLLRDGDPQTVSDYRETLGELLLENFTEQWTAWAHKHGAQTRNQAHGSPANLIDLYAAVDIPEIEGFGLSNFGIKGLRTDPGFTRKNDSDVSMLKYASSAAHITGKPLTSSETFTWLTEHFRTSLSQMKPDLDLMFSCGVNHAFFHGTCYSPKDDPWPGWKFYASVDMSPTNTIWRDAGELMTYIERCQSMLQQGKPDNDFLVYLPVRDMWRQTKPGQLMMMFSIHAMGKLAPDFIKSILEIDKLGFDCDYISDKYLLTTTFSGGKLRTAAGTEYSALIIPGSGLMPEKVKTHLDALKAQGANIIYGIDDSKISSAAKPEKMRKEGLRVLRRKTADGYIYFVANLSSKDFEKAEMPLSKEFASIYALNPIDGSIRKVAQNNGNPVLSLRSGESVFLRTYNDQKTSMTAKALKLNPTGAAAKKIEGEKWTLTFVESMPQVAKKYELDNLRTWEFIDDSLRTLAGTGVYETTFKISKKEAAQKWLLDLGDVRESARVYINGKYIGCAWAVPYVLDPNEALKKGTNTIKIEVTNLPANRIAQLDREGVEWRKFKEINVVDINYKKTKYDEWKPVPSGLNSPVRLIPAE